MSDISPKQVAMIHGLFKSANLAHQKSNIVLGFTNQQIESVADMNKKEADALIKYLLSQTPKVEIPAKIEKVEFDENKRQEYAQACANMRNKILAMAHNNGWQIQHTNGSMVVDLEHLNNWLTKYVGNSLNSLSATKLQKAITQLEQMKFKQLEK